MWLIWSNTWVSVISFKTISSKLSHIWLWQVLEQQWTDMEDDPSYAIQEIMNNNWDAPLRKINSRLETRFWRNRWEEDGTKAILLNHSKNTVAQKAIISTNTSLHIWTKCSTYTRTFARVYVTVYGVPSLFSSQSHSSKHSSPSSSCNVQRIRNSRAQKLQKSHLRKLQSLNSDSEKKIIGGNRSTKCCAYSVAEWHYSDSLHW